MTPGLSVLTLRPAVLRREWLDGNITRYPESHYLDFVVDGRSCSAIPDGPANLVTHLNRAWLPMVPDAIRELLGERPTEGLSEGRASLLVCGTCGDLACGAVTVSLRVLDDTVTWSKFAWENGCEPATQIDGAPESVAFDRHDYTDVLTNAYGRVAEFPYDELSHRGRKFLWPWQWGWRLPRS